MKVSYFLFLLFTLNACAMHDYTWTQAMCQAIQKSDVKEFEHLFQLTKPEHNGLESMRLLLNRYQLNTAEIQRESTAMKKLSEQRARTLCNASFYKKLGIGAACLGSAALLTTLFIAIPITNNEFDFLKNGLTIGSSVSIMTALGIKHLKDAYSNEDAVNEYAKQLAIKYFVQKIRPAKPKEQI